jgi:predicted nucleic acid-binding protein
MRIVLDTSVAVAWYLDETGCETARKWQTECLAGHIDVLVPSLHYFEFANVLRTYVRRRELTAAQAEAIYSLHLDAPVTVMEPERESLLRTAIEFDATAYDAAYVLVAIAQDALLVTAERATTPWVRKLGRQAVVISSP